MKIKSLKTYGGKFLLAGLAAVAISLGSAKAGAPDDQIAIQLGSIYMTGSPVATTDQQALANYLVEGRGILASTSKKVGSTVASAVTFTKEDVTTLATQKLILRATQAALATPQKISVTGTVSLFGGKTLKVKAVLDPIKTTASAIAAVALKRTPNYGPIIAQNAVTAAFAGQGTPLFGYKGATPQKLQAAQLTDAGKAASLALSTALKAYAKGTQNWIGVPTGGTVIGATYLPNLGTKPLPSANVGSQQLATPGLITKFASAIAANAINGLGAISDGAAGTYGKTKSNVQSLTTALVKGAAAFQKVSLTPDITPGQKTVGAIGASVLGIVAQVSGDQNGGTDLTSFGTKAIYKDVLQGVVSGAIAAAKTQAWAVAIGVAQGFAGTYLASTYNAGHTPITLLQFKDFNTDEIVTALQTANGGKSFTKSQLGVYADIKTAVNTGIEAIWTAFNNGGVRDFSNISGAAGISNFGLINGVGSPVTDTVGI